jgi:potassium efflux system protein
MVADRATPRGGRPVSAEAGGGQAAKIGGEAGEMDVPDDIAVDLSLVKTQTSSLIRTGSVIAFVVGAWLIWASVLPALAVLDRVELWPREAIGPDGTPIIAWTTLQDIALAIVTLIITVTAARNLPGLIQIAVLRNLPLEPSIRYAITTVSSYVLSFVGIVAAVNLVGFSWSSLQWLVAALGVGIGFGLQEVIANFVCGLILLFERPIRVGDWVTVGETSGTVSRIRIRATTILDWDRKEMLIPNKELITGRVLNWTLSNTLNRVMINVGVAYGTDTERARELLLQVARAHPKVIDDPAPLATFEGFGDSTLNFVLRAYLEDFDGRLSIMSELHTAIDEAFKEAGIEIAFPQLDLHLRSTGAEPAAEPDLVIPRTAPKPTTTEQKAPR